MSLKMLILVSQEWVIIFLKISQEFFDDVLLLVSCNSLLLFRAMADLYVVIEYGFEMLTLIIIKTQMW